MEFQVLGPLRLLGPDRRLVPLASAAQRRIMSLLVAHAGTVVSADTLASHLRLSPGALRTAVSRLRRVVGFDVLVTAPPGYQLVTDEVDAVRFARLVAQARAQPGPAARRARLEAALALWRGDAYAEFAHEHWAIGEARRLAELRAGAVEDLVEILVGRREWSPAIDRLHALIATDPLRDRPHGLLMRALAGSGRQADALRVFQAHRALLADETGTEPSSELVAIDRAIAGWAPPVETVPATGLTVLLTELVGAGPGGGEPGPGGERALDRHDEILDQVVFAAGGSRPLEQGEGDRAAATFPSAADALCAAVEAQRRMVHEVPGAPVRMALHTGVPVIRGAGRYSVGTIPQCARLRARCFGGQIVVSDTTRGAAAGRPRDVGFVELGPLDLRGSRRAEPVWQVVHRDLPRTFPPWGRADRVSRAR
jgi:DNA-binding SARP family transcriptional activator